MPCNQCVYYYLHGIHDNVSQRWPVHDHDDLAYRYCSVMSEYCWPLGSTKHGDSRGLPARSVPVHLWHWLFATLLYLGEVGKWSPHRQMWGRKQIVCNANIKNDHSEHLKVVICGNRTRFACPPLPRFTGADSPGSSQVTPFLEATDVRLVTPWPPCKRRDENAVVKCSICHHGEGIPWLISSQQDTCRDRGSTDSSI